MRELLPGRSSGAGGIKEDDRGEGCALHERIIMHGDVCVNPVGGMPSGAVCVILSEAKEA
jgi:hypothetical protein